MPTTTAAKKALADGVWVEKKDPKSGKAYYMNKATKRTTWDLDKELAKAPAAASTTPAKPAAQSSTSPAKAASTPAKAADPVAAALASGTWVEKKDPKSGKAYYFNKATKKTTWDLAKELGVASAASPAAAVSDGQATAAKPTTTEPAKPLPGQQRTVAQVLAEGTWVERSDPKTGRTFYFNKETKKATWDLVKELGLAPAAEVAAKPAEPTQTASSPAAAAAAASANNAYSVDHVLASGKWKASKDFNGSTYYMHVETGETTADLALYLQIQQALDGADDVCAGRGGDDGGAGAGTDMSEWISLILRAPGHEQAADRLIAPHVQRRLDDAERAVKAARLAEDEQRRRAEGLERSAAQMRDVVAAHQKEIHQLQCAVFYGLQGGGGGGSHGGYAPAMMDPVSAGNPSNPGSLGTRVEYLENLLRSVQGHNRQLQAELEGLRRRGHEQATCRHCDDNDPFTRVLRKAAPVDGQHGPAGTAAAPRPMADPYAVTSTITPLNLLGPSPVSIAADRPGNAALARLHQHFDRGSDRRPPGVPAPLNGFPTSRQLQFVGSSADQVDLHAVPSAITHGSPLRHGIAGRR